MARIKSRPTTLLAQGAGVHLKNGFHQPGQVMGPFIPPSYVSGSQTGPTTAVAPSPLYTHGQSVSGKQTNRIQRYAALLLLYASTVMTNNYFVTGATSVPTSAKL